MMLVATVAAVSCNKSTQTCELSTFKAKCPAVEDESKTYLQEGKDVVWAANDAINVLTASNNEKYTLTEGAASKEGTFSGNPVTGDAYAVYPYNASATFADGVITTTLAATQNARDKGFGNNLNLAVAQEDNGTFAFKNVCGLIKFQIKGDNIGKVVISGNNGEDLAGKVNISFNDQGEPVYEVVDGSKTVIVQTYNGAVMAPGTYYAAVLPQTFSKGITITCKPYAFKTDAVIKKVYAPKDLVKKGEGALELKRAGIVPVGYIDRGPVWDYSGQQVFVGAIRGSDTAHGHYLDMSTGRTIFPIGANAYAVNCDLAMITNGSNGIAPMSMTAIGGFTNSTNIGYLGTYAEADNVSKWPADVRSNNLFCYVTSSELTDAQYSEIKTVDEIKAIYDAHSANLVQKYFISSTDCNCVTSANKTTDHKFLVIKTYSSVEGTGYGIIMFNGLSAGGTTSPKQWYINTSYKWGLEAPAAK